MTELFQQLLDWVTQHPHWSGMLIFLVSMAESLAIIGLIVPGVAIMFGIGAMIAAGSIEFGTAVAWAVVGAVVGDGLSFWLGHHYKENLRGIWPFTRYPKSLIQGTAFFEKYGSKSVIIGRFFGPVRAIIPLVAGMMGMQPWRFALANILSALAWAPAYLLPGMVFGTSLKLASEVAFRLVIVILLLVLIIWLTVWLVHHIFLMLSPKASRLLQSFLSWGNRHPMIEGITGALANPDHPEAKGLSILATLLLITSALFTLITGWSLNEGVHSGINYTVLESLQSLRTPWTDHLMVFITGLGDIESIALFFALVMTYLLWGNHRRAALYWLAAAGFALLVGPLLKYGFQIPRPNVVAQAGASYAFPSGHTLWAMMMYGFFSVLVARTTTPRWRWIPFSFAGLLISSIAISRLYLGVHWLSDVLGSLALGLAWISLLGIAYNRHATPVSESRSLIIIGLFAILLALTVHSLYFHNRRFQFYQPVKPVIQMSEVHWWKNGWHELPQERWDTRKRREHRLSLQFVGTLDSFTSAMATAGWQKADPLGWKKLIELLSPSLTLQELPIFPQVHDGSHESLALSKLLPGGRRLVLRFWPAYMRLTPGGRNLWVGLVGEQTKVEVLNTIAFAATAPSHKGALTQLLADTSSILDRRLTGTGVILMRKSKALK
ncbi:MAG: phosphatase PAP2 family protein [Gammaproteobacteria bacterium]|nr:phosphatase PAP2 family protein [Gammaproteobacteria bacterium]